MKQHTMRMLSISFFCQYCLTSIRRTQLGFISCHLASFFSFFLEFSVWVLETFVVRDLSSNFYLLLINFTWGFLYMMRIHCCKFIYFLFLCRNSSDAQQYVILFFQKVTNPLKGFDIKLHLLMRLLWSLQQRTLGFSSIGI